jgi:hypothetical protein
MNRNASLAPKASHKRISSNHPPLKRISRNHPSSHKLESSIKHPRAHTTLKTHLAFTAKIRHFDRTPSAVEGVVEKPASPPAPSNRSHPKSLVRTTVIASILFIAASIAIPSPAHPQGCTQCQDNTAATPPRTQAAYRHAIILMTLTAAGLFVATISLFKRHR